MTWRRTAAVAAVLICGASVGCSSDDAADAPLQQVAPTKADVAEEAGIVFPDSTTDFRLVRVGAGQVDVTFTLDPDDVAAFADGSGIELEDGKRVITHASPIWDVAVQAAVRGGSSTKQGVRRDVEVVRGDPTDTVRLSLVPE